MRNIGAIEDLRTIKKIFKKHGETIFLMYGTLLGAYRDKDILYGDMDIDIGTFAVKKMNAIWIDLEKEGFVKRKGAWKCGYLPVNRNFTFDILFFHDDEGDSDYKCYSHGSSRFRFPKKFGKMKRIKFHGNYYLAPSPIEDYLKHFYGNWEDKTLRNHAC